MIKVRYIEEDITINGILLEHNKIYDVIQSQYPESYTIIIEYRTFNLYKYRFKNLRDEKIKKILNES